MADKEVQPQTAESETQNLESITPSYSVIVYPAKKLPRDYHPLLFSRWLRSLRFGNTLFKKISSNDYYKSYQAFIEKLLDKPDCVIRLAVLSDDHDVVLGFAVSREDVLDYIHVHTDYRRIGVGRSLFPQGITTFSHITATAIIIWQGNDKYKELKFNPFA